jgi:hypothetical protein
MCEIKKPRKGGQRSILDYKRVWMNEIISMQNYSWQQIGVTKMLYSRGLQPFPGKGRISQYTWFRGPITSTDYILSNITI